MKKLDGVFLTVFCLDTWICPLLSVIWILICLYIENSYKVCAIMQHNIIITVIKIIAIIVCIFVV